MDQKQNFTKPTDHALLLVKPVLTGAAIALLVVSFFVFGADAPDPEWGRLWKIKPLVLTPLAGAIGGVIYYFINHLGIKGILSKNVTFLLSLAGYVIALWLGVVLGLSNTMWD